LLAVAWSGKFYRLPPDNENTVKLEATVGQWQEKWWGEIWEKSLSTLWNERSSDQKMEGWNIRSLCPTRHGYFFGLLLSECISWHKVHVYVVMHYNYSNWIVVDVLVTKTTTTIKLPMEVLHDLDAICFIYFQKLINVIINMSPFTYQLVDNTCVVT